jgi:GNAT superfamily N-acetyltransferase
MIYEAHNLDTLSDDDHQALPDLCYPDGNLLAAYQELREISCPYTRVYLARTDSGKIVAWALLDCSDAELKPDYMVYVNKEYREQGIGSILLGMALEEEGEFVVYEHDSVSSSFYRGHAGTGIEINTVNDITRLAS